MMSHMTLLAGLGLGALLAWWVTRSLEGTRYAGRVRELESRVRFKEGEAFDLRKQLAGFQGQLAQLKGTFETQRQGHASTVAALTASFKRSVFTLGTVALVMGAAVGGVSSWALTRALTNAKWTTEVAQSEMSGRLAQIQLEVLKQQLEQQAGELKSLRIQLTDAKVAREVAKTKLSILLESLDHNRGVEGFVIDYQKLRHNLEGQLQEGALQEIAPARSGGF